MYTLEKGVYSTGWDKLYTTVKFGAAGAICGLTLLLIGNALYSRYYQPTEPKAPGVVTKPVSLTSFGSTATSTTPASSSGMVATSNPITQQGSSHYMPLNMASPAPSTTVTTPVIDTTPVTTGTDLTSGSGDSGSDGTTPPTDTSGDGGSTGGGVDVTLPGGTDIGVGNPVPQVDITTPAASLSL